MKKINNNFIRALITIAVTTALYVSPAKSEENDCISNDMTRWHGYSYLNHKELLAVRDKLPDICKILKDKDAEERKKNIII